MRRTIQARDGYLLPSVVLFIILSIALGMAMLELGTLAAREAVRSGRRERAFYLAEGGLEYAHAHLHNRPAWRPEDDPIHARSGFGNVRIDRFDDDGLTITSSVMQDNEVVLRLSQTYSDSTYSISATGFVWIGFQDVNEDHLWRVFENEDGEFEEVKDESVLSEGDRDDYPEKFPMPPPDWTGGEDYSPYADENGDLSIGGEVYTIPPGDHVFRDIKATAHGKIVLQDGARLYVTGDIQLPSSGTIEIAEAETGEETKGVDIYVEEDSRVQLPGNVLTLSEDPSHLRIFSNSSRVIESGDDDVKFPSHALFYGVIYAPDASVDLVNHTEFHGAIVAHTLLGRRHTEMKYYEHLEDLSLGTTTGSVSRLVWTKPDWESYFE